MRNVLLLIVVMKLSTAATGWAQHWPHWRGPTHDGVSAERGLPDTAFYSDAFYTSADATKKLA